VAKIDEDSLPERANIHYLGGKPYDELPDYLAGWDVALMPFALNESTRFISPTKTPEYLAGGRPVVSTPITDVVRTYGNTGIVRIARNAPEFIAAIDAGLKDMQSKDSLQQAADSVLEGMSWDNTWELMEEKINAQFEELRYGRDSGLAANQ
jgi:glycosyltransferase involved in cell wall biosynthesis